MRIAQEKNVVVIAIIKACELAALWPMGTSTARHKSNQI
jgi:hypothetical protein